MANESNDYGSLITINQDNVTINGNVKNYTQENENAKIEYKNSVAQVGNTKYMTIEEVKKNKSSLERNNKNAW